MAARDSSRSSIKISSVENAHSLTSLLHQLIPVKKTVFFIWVAEGYPAMLATQRGSIVSGSLTLPKSQGLSPLVTWLYKLEQTSLEPHGFYIYLYNHD